MLASPATPSSQRDAECGLRAEQNTHALGLLSRFASAVVPRMRAATLDAVAGRRQLRPVRRCRSTLTFAFWRRNWSREAALVGFRVGIMRAVYLDCANTGSGARPPRRAIGGSPHGSRG